MQEQKSKFVLVTKEVYNKDLTKTTGDSSYICGMTSKTWEAKCAYPEMRVVSDLETPCNFMLIEPLLMRQHIANPDGDHDTRKKAFLQRMDHMKMNPALKLAWSEEQELLRWDGKSKDMFLAECKELLTCNQYHYKQLSSIAKDIPMRILRTPISSEFYAPAQKQMKVIAMGRVCSAKNVEGVIEIFKRLPSDIEKVYIGNQSMWGVAPNPINEQLEKSLQAVVDRWIPLASREEVARELSTALGYFNVSIYDVGCLSFLEAAMSACHCFAWRFHPMFDEYTACHRFTEYAEGAKLIADTLKAAENQSDMVMREQVYNWHSYEAFRKSVDTIILENVLGVTEPSTT